MNQTVYKTLKAVASKGDCPEGITTYAAVGDLIGLRMGDPGDRTKISRILGEISTDEHNHGRPMLSAVVVKQEIGRPGSGFFQLAKQLKLQILEDNDEFWQKELKRVYAYWHNRHDID